MKKFSILLTVLVLTISMLTGCGCTRRGAETETMPATEMTILPTNIPETTAPVIPTTEPMTEPATEATDNTDTMSTEDSGITGSITDETGTRSRIR